MVKVVARGRGHHAACTLCHAKAGIGRLPAAWLARCSGASARLHGRAWLGSCRWPTLQAAAPLACAGSRCRVPLPRRYAPLIATSPRSDYAAGYEGVVHCGVLFPASGRRHAVHSLPRACEPVAQPLLFSNTRSTMISSPITCISG
jgi:hypothetical protein